MSPAEKPAPPRQKRLLTWALAAFALLCCLAVLYYIAVPARHFYHSDTTDTLYWAQASYESGRLISPDFYYAAILPFGGSLLMLPFYALFGFTLTAHILGMGLFAVVFMAALWFFITALEMDLRRKLVIFSGTLLMLLSSEKLREIVWDHVIYYSLGMLFFLLFAGLCLRIYRRVQQGKKKTPTVVLGVVLLVLAALVGLDGAQVMVFCTLPLAAALVAERFFDTSAPVLSKGNRLPYMLAGVLLAGGAAGMLLLSLTGGGETPAYAEGFLVFSDPESWGQIILSIPMHWATLLGYSAAAGEPLLSAGSILQLLRLAAAVIVAVAPFALLKRYKTIQSYPIRLTLWYHVALCALTLAANVVGSTGTVNWRYSPLAFSSILLTFIYFCHVLKAPSRQRFLSLLAAAMLAACLVNLGGVAAMPTRRGKNHEMHELADVLEANDLHYGFADFWTSQILTLLTDRDTRVCNAYTLDGGVFVTNYQSDPGWYCEQPGVDRYFLITDDEWIARTAGIGVWQDIYAAQIQRIDYGEYVILVFDHIPFDLWRYDGKLPG